ncbi:hypothetical protein WEH80_05010 [Actinomycetes bacterium KLBMP 9759]
MGSALLAVPGTRAPVVGTILAFGPGWVWPGLLQFAVVRPNPSAPAAATSIVQVGVYAGGFLGPVDFGFIAAELMVTGRQTPVAPPNPSRTTLSPA